MMELELVPKDDKPSPTAAPKGEKPVYQGVERRHQMRRVCVDRRSMVRFESHTERRHGHERRAELRLWDGRDR